MFYHNLVKMNMEASWIESAGGPLIMASDKSLLSWHGHEGDEPTDYDKVCRIADYLGLISHHEDNILVFGGDPLPLIYCASDDRDMSYFVRWINGDSDELVLNAARTSVKDIEGKPLLLRINSVHQIVFDAACPGRSFDESNFIRIVFPAVGMYEVVTSECNPNDATAFVLHRIKRLRG